MHLSPTSLSTFKSKHQHLVLRLQPLLKPDHKPSKLTIGFIKPLTTVFVAMAHASVASIKTKVEIDSHADT